MALKLMGKKRGMIQVFDDKGNVIVCTVIEAEPNVITQVKTKEKDGYTAIQTSFEKVKVKDPRTLDRRTTKPMRGHFAKASVEPRKHLVESRVEAVDEFNLGQELNVDMFADVPFVDVIGLTKGKGYQGVMKKYGFAGGPASHGSSFHRHAGSTGMRTTPGRCFPGAPRASHMGYEQKTVQNVQVIQVHSAENVLVVKGQVPGPVNGLVYISQAVKKTKPKKHAKK